MLSGLENIGIHPTAIVDSGAQLGENVSVGPFAVIGPRVVIGAGTRIGPHVFIERNTTIGRECAVHAGAVLGSDPQDLKFGGEETHLVIGDHTVIREYATLNRGTAALGSTQIGSHCLLMSYSHVAHDCVLSDHVIISNAVNMGGHVSIGEWAIVGGLTAIHQFVRIGPHAFVGGAARVQKDVPPYVKAAGSPLALYGLNSVGLQRRGFSEEVRFELKKAYRLIFNSSYNVSQALARAREELTPSPEVEAFLGFIEASDRGVAL
ncbi:MAG TPA: acyl-ACP--UDP-N-acetylglucosamine O-acyltransferase [Longimicrobiales bacterium]|nr:acyl-ACP--UDP-N-acetylglucosamine O-acyltransferase [Longimicrobiales bacterium]